jgi:hypothetical protein
MGEIRKVWTDGKSHLSKEQLAKIPKEDFGQTADQFEASCATAIKKLKEAEAALSTVWEESEGGAKGVRSLLEHYAQQIAKDKDVSKAMGLTIVEVDRKKAGFLKKVMLEYAHLNATAKKFAKYSGN